MLKITEKYIIAFDKGLKERILSLMKKDWHLEVLDFDGSLDSEANNKELQETNYMLSSVDFAISFLSPFEEKRSLIEKLKNPKIIVKKDVVNNFEKEEEIKNVVNELVQTEKEMKTIEEGLNKNNEKLKELNKFGSLNFVPQETENVTSFIIRIDLQKKKDYLEFLRVNDIFNKEINIYQSKIYLAIICLKEKEEEEFLTFLKENLGEIVDYSFEKIPSEEKEILLKEIEEKKNKVEEIREKIAGKAIHLDNLKIYYDILCLREGVIKVKKKTLVSNFLNYITFWAIKEEKERFELELNKISQDFKIIKVELEKEEEPPVILYNKRALSPFQAVTDIFGLPRSGEIDPTPYLSLFFILFFGICLTDAGYGLFIMLFTGSLLFFFKESFGNSNLIKLMFYAGVSTLIMGILFGSYFGVSPEAIGLPFMSKFKVMDPIKDTLLFMIIAFILGYIQICFSQIVKMIASKKAKNKQNLISAIVWLGFYLSVGAYLFTFLKSFATIGLLGFGLALFIVEGKGQKLILIPLVGAIKILQGLINTVSDILSYSRLMALGLGTGVIALVVNQIAALLGSSVPYVGWLFAVVILIFGHTFNLGINTLGGFIHSARLQFVEFFPKFMEGGGRRLNPVQKELRYIKIN
ncbi:hypothetical protein KKA24_01560 [Patescibacteria group bacterium]|nr:hypothetical protein [Patescibacteria group bacterium]